MALNSFANHSSNLIQAAATATGRSRTRHHLEVLSCCEFQAPKLEVPNGKKARLRVKENAACTSYIIVIIQAQFWLKIGYHQNFMVEKFMFPTTIAIRINPTLSQIQKLCVILQQPATRMDSRDIWSRFLQQNVIAPRCHIDMLEQEVPRSQQISAAYILASTTRATFRWNVAIAFFTTQAGGHAGQGVTMVYKPISYEYIYAYIPLSIAKLWIYLP